MTTEKMRSPDVGKSYDNVQIIKLDLCFKFEVKSVALNFQKISSLIGWLSTCSKASRRGFQQNGVQHFLILYRNFNFKNRKYSYNGIQQAFIGNAKKHPDKMARCDLMSFYQKSVATIPVQPRPCIPIIFSSLKWRKVG